MYYIPSQMPLCIHPWNLIFLVFVLTTLGFDCWWSSSCSSSLVTLMYVVSWSSSWGFSLAALNCEVCFCWYARTCVFHLKLFIPMLVGLYWSSPYAFKTLMNDLRFIFSQDESSNILKIFCLYVCKFATLHCEFNAFSIWQERDVHKTIRVSQLMYRIWISIGFL
jgi:hypothetical protein